MEPLEKRCKACQRILSIEAFEKNQHLKDGSVARRSECNTGMGNFKDNIGRLKRAVEWIKGTLK